MTYTAIFLVRMERGDNMTNIQYHLSSSKFLNLLSPRFNKKVKKPCINFQSTWENAFVLLNVRKTPTALTRTLSFHPSLPSPALLEKSCACDMPSNSRFLPSERISPKSPSPPNFYIFLLSLFFPLFFLLPRLECLHAHKSPNLFEDDKLQRGGGCESAPDGYESPPKRPWSLLCDNLGKAVDGVGVNLSIWGLVHQAGADHVERRHLVNGRRTSGRDGKWAGSRPGQGEYVP